MTHRPISRHKLAFLTWACTYPMITLVLLTLGPFLIPNVPIFVTTLVATAIVVPANFYVIQPNLIRMLDGWLRS